MDLAKALAAVEAKVELQDVLDNLVMTGKLQESSILNNRGAFYQIIYLISVGLLPETNEGIIEALEGKV